MSIKETEIHNREEGSVPEESIAQRERQDRQDADRQGQQDEQNERTDQENRGEQKKRTGILKQVIILFACGTLLIGVFTYFTQQVMTDTSVKRQMERIASNIAGDAMNAFQEYPGYRWLVQYWYDHADEMDIEYDVDYGPGTETEKKIQLLRRHQPDLLLDYAQEKELAALPPEDQKLYAEILYTRILMQIDQIKDSYDVDYLFCVLSDDTYEKQFFVMSGAQAGASRGTGSTQAYILGVISDVSESQTRGMQLARENHAHLANAGDYVDYYAYMDTIGDQNMLIGLTYDLAELNRSIHGRTLEGTILAMIAELLLAWVCLALIYRLVLQPLKTIQENIRFYMRTKDSGKVCANLADVRPSNEIGQLSIDVSDMTREIDQHIARIKEISETEERLRVELSLASEIQKNMLPFTFPAFPDRPEFTLYATMQPAREVGGDLYNCFLIDDDHLCVLIADVSGKGVPAAMFMMATQIILENNSTKGRTPDQVIEEVNERICASNREDMFVTIWYSILEISTGTLTAVNAGHEYPFVYRAKSGFSMLRDPHGVVVGGLEGIKYKSYEIQLEPGDRIFVYTDGVAEAKSNDNSMFGTDRLLDILNQPVQSPKDILSNVLTAVEDFTAGAEQFDDLTMLCLEYNGCED